MAYAPLTKIPQQFFNNLGNPLVGGTISAFLAGTSTPTNMFSDNAGTVAGTTVTLDSRGEPTTFKLIWLDSTKNYKFILKDSSGTTIDTWDNINGGYDLPVSQSIFDQQKIVATAGQTVFNLSSSYTTGFNYISVYKNGARLLITDDYTESSSTSVTLTTGAIANDEYLFVILTPGSSTTAIRSQKAIATSSQTVFNLSFAYTPGQHALAVYKNGARLILADDYVETNSTTVTLTMAAVTNDEYLFTTFVI